MVKIKPTMLLAVIMSLAVIVSACQTKGNRTSNDNASPAPAEEGKANTAPVALNTFASFAPEIENPATNEFTKFLEEKLNIKFKFDIAPSEGVDDKKQIVLASGDYPAVFLNVHVTKAEQLKYGQQGVFIPLNDLIDQYAPNLKKRFEEVPGLKAGVTAPDGNIYGLPAINECYHCSYPRKLWINTKWLDALQLKMPTTTDELLAVLKAFKTQDPNKNGKADEIALSGAINTWYGETEPFLMNPFIYDDRDTYLEIKDGKVDFVADKEGWKQGLAYMNQLYKEGVLDPAAFTQNLDALVQLGNQSDSEVLGAFTAGHVDMVTDPKTGRDKDYAAVPPLKGPDGTQLASFYGFDVGDAVFLITNKATEEEQIAAIKLADYLSTDEGTLWSAYGPKGKYWDTAGPDDKDFLGRPAKYKVDPSFTANLTQNVNWAQGGPIYQTADFRNSFAVPQDPMAADGYELRLYQETKNKYDGHKPDEVFPASIFPDPANADEYGQLKKQLQDYVNQSLVKFVFGRSDLDKDWDDYVSGLQKFNLDRYLELSQKQYDEFKKNQ